MQSLGLPSPDPSSLSHCESVRDFILQEINQSGPMSFARYMQLALYEPGFGYYAVGTKKFGASGDFVTAPEISTMFGQCLAHQFEVIQKENQHANILELGPGSGKLCADILMELSAVDVLPTHYYLLEVSASLQQVQREYLQKTVPDLMSRITWLSEWPDENSFDGLVIANEVLDAMPVHLFQIEDEVHERFVDCEGDEFVWRVLPANSELINSVEALGVEFSQGYFSEINLAIPAWIQSLYSMMNSGVVLLIDYGFLRHEFYHPQRNEGTLMCHYQHHAFSDPLVLPGIQDITAHVDFTAVIDGANAAGFEVVEFSSQANYLLNQGLLSIAEKKMTSDVDQFVIANEIKQLTMPSEMGELFKVVVLAK